MKHIFTVHSPITFLMAISIIKTNKLAEDKIVILSSGYVPPTKPQYLKNSFDSLNRSITKKIIHWNTPKEYDNYIDSLLDKDENYVAYIDLMHMHQRILITNKKCLNFSFIEEGTASYLLPQTLENVGYLFKNNNDRFGSLKDILFDFRFLLRGYNSKLISMSFTPQSYNDIALNYYCLSSAAYPNVDTLKKKIIKLEELDLDAIFPQTLALSSALIWVEETFSYVYNIPELEYELAIKKTINKLSNELKNRTIYLKKRPNQKDNKSLVYKTLVQNGFDVKILEDNLILEVVLHKSEDCLLIGNISSLLYYGTLLGHKSFSMFDVMKNKPKTPFDDLNFFWDAVSKV